MRVIGPPKLGEEEGAPPSGLRGSTALLTTGSQISSLRLRKDTILLLSVTLLVNLCHCGHGKLVTSEGPGPGPPLGPALAEECSCL